MLEIYFETYGCSANYNSTEIMKGLVRQAGFNITSNIDFADFVVINSCIVKEPTQEKIRRKIQVLLKKGKKIILAGCMPRINQKQFDKDGIFLLDTSHVKNVVNLIKDIVEDNYDSDKYLINRNEIKLNLPKISNEKFIGITQISEGCLGECTYCITRVAKGKLFSYPKEKIIESIKSDVEAGCKEIWITSQDNASYGNEEGKFELVNLLKDIVKIKGNFFVRIGMMNPNNVLEILPELIDIYKNKKIFKFLHLPIQSGNDKILKAMGRKYNRKDIIHIIDSFKKEFPNMHISTDIIVGFPGETENDFRETYEMVEYFSPETINVSKFWPRPYTVAEKLKNQIDLKARTKRAGELGKLHKEICNKNQKLWEYWKGKVLVDQKGFGNTYLARDENYKLFAVNSKENVLGKVVKVRVSGTTPHYLFANTC